MATWELVWKIVFWGGLGIFAAMAVWVTIAGAFDIRRMLRTMREDDAAEDQDPPR